MDELVPISIDRNVQIDNIVEKGRGDPVPEEVLASIIIGCSRGIKRLGRLGGRIRAVKVTTRSESRKYTKENSWYALRIVLVGTGSQLSKEEQEADLIVRVSVYPIETVKIPVEEHIATLLFDVVTSEVKRRAKNLKEHAKAWTELMEN